MVWALFRQCRDLTFPRRDDVGGGKDLASGAPVVSICRMSEHGLSPILNPPSGGDCSYPGMVIDRGVLWVSYYSSHEGRARIYLARIRLE